MLGGTVGLRRYARLRVVELNSVAAEHKLLRICSGTLSFRQLDLKGLFRPLGFLAKDLVLRLECAAPTSCR